MVPVSRALLTSTLGVRPQLTWLPNKMARLETVKYVVSLATGLGAIYSWATGLYFHTLARRPHHRTGVEPFILWRNECLTPEGLELRRRGTRAMWRYVFIIVGFGVSNWYVRS